MTYMNTIRISVLYLNRFVDAVIDEEARKDRINWKYQKEKSI